MRNRLVRYCLSLLSVPSLEDFDDKDQKLIDDWLKLSISHKGFHKYLKARDRAFVEAQIKMPIETPQERQKYYEYQGARLENARLFHRAERVKERESKQARKNS